ncbi:tudor domain-containing protein 6-like [Alosa pseudoharengus]|uniref:tudor domain-containing protein 6-like n=1 Tax=Alosa pseudoharengus TaxID=34774 RepID=UPI003F8C96E1
MTNLQTLPPEFNQLEGQSFRCSLYNLIEPTDGKSWSNEASHSLKEFVFEKSVSLKCTIHAELYVKNIGLCNVVDLHTTSEQATTFLVKQGLAVKVQPLKPLIPTAYPVSFMYSSFGLTPGSKEKIYVTHVASPWEIYCQLGRNGEAIEKLMETIAKESGETLCSKSTVKPGSLCLAKYSEDGKWYRGISKPVLSNELLNVFFVDYGNKQIVEKSNVKPLEHSTTDLLMAPMQALKCSLANIPKGETLAEVNTWLENISLNKPVQATFMAKDKDGTFSVDMFDGDTHINEKIREVIAAHEVREKGSVTDNANTERVPPQNQRTVRAVHDPGHNKRSPDKPELKKVFNRDHKSFKHPESRSPTTPRKQPENKTAGSKKRDCEQLLQSQDCDMALPKLDSLPEIKVKSGFTGVGFASHVNSINNFFIQMQEDEANILKMGEDLNCSSFKEKAQNVKSELHNGDLIAAEFEEDGALYRAVVTDASKKRNFSIEFIDYGNVATVDQSKVYRLTSEFLSQPRLCIPCSLVKTHSLVNHPSFEAVLKDKPFEVEFIRQTGTHWEVKMNLKEFKQSEHDTEMGKETKESATEQENQPQELFMDPVTIGQEYSGFVAAVTNPGEFYIALEDQDHNVITTAVSDALESLPDLLSTLPDAHLIPGAACLIRHKDTKKWCRAEILHVDGASVVMNLVDYGVCTHILQEHRGKLKILPAELARLPKVIYPCLLRGIKPADDGQWSDCAVIFFQELICHRNLKIFFRQCISEMQWEVDILMDGVCLAKALVDADHALYIDLMLGLRFEQEHSQNLRSSPERQVTSHLADTPDSVQKIMGTNDELTVEIPELTPEGADLYSAMKNVHVKVPWVSDT